MSDNQENIKKKKTLSLKLGSKPLIAPKRNIEAGKTVIVEKKRYKRNPNSENQFQKLAKSDPPSKHDDISDSQSMGNSQNKSGVLLKPLTKDEQKRILKADNKKDKKDEIEKKVVTSKAKGSKCPVCWKIKETACDRVNCAVN